MRIAFDIHTAETLSFELAPMITYVKYSDQFSVFSSDIIQYLCAAGRCRTSHAHCEQVVFFGRDRRFNFLTVDKIPLKVRSIICQVSFMFILILSKHSQLHLLSSFQHLFAVPTSYRTYLLRPVCGEERQRGQKALMRVFEVSSARTHSFYDQG
jgi:hypothetical protein